MNSEKETLRKRELEVQRLMRQMKFDELQKSQVYRNLEHELQKIQQNLDSLAEQGNFSTTSASYSDSDQK
jgi:AAA+ ATPase superfamily predicted ATPase